MLEDTAYFCEIENGGVTLLECRGYDSLAAVPKDIEGRPVTALAPYLFSSHPNYNDTKHCLGFWWSPEKGRIPKEETKKLPPVKGEVLEELSLPASLKQVGSYGLYNCEKLRRLKLHSTTLDWGPGVFTGCSNVKELTIHVDESCKSCMKEILAELRQTLRVTYIGRGTAELIFPEFFEEAVENTPARILVTNTHGCGKQYRNAFVGTQFQFQEYDSLFPHVQVQEPEELVTELALGRIMSPYGLSEKHRQQYMEYLKEHKERAACQAAKAEDMERLLWLTENMIWDKEELKRIIAAAGNAGNMGAVSFLMNKTAGGEGNRKRKRFVL